MCIRCILQVSRLQHPNDIVQKGTKWSTQKFQRKWIEHMVVNSTLCIIIIVVVIALSSILIGNCISISSKSARGYIIYIPIDCVAWKPKHITIWIYSIRLAKQDRCDLSNIQIQPIGINWIHRITATKIFVSSSLRQYSILFVIVLWYPDNPQDLSVSCYILLKLQQLM